MTDSYVFAEVEDLTSGHSRATLRKHLVVDQSRVQMGTGNTLVGMPGHQGKEAGVQEPQHTCW